MSIFLIIISLFLIVREPLKHINIEAICPNVVFICIHDTTIDFGMFVMIDNNSLKFEINFLHSFSIAPCFVKTSGVKLPYLISTIFLLYLRFLSGLVDATHCLMALNWCLKALGSKILWSENAF